MTYQVTYSPRSRRDLEKIHAYISRESGSAETAARFLRRLLEECDALETLPQRFPPYPYALLNAKGPGWGLASLAFVL